MPKPFLSVVIPAYNEAKRIPLTLVDVDRYLRTQKYTYEILVVNDGSKDETATIVTKMTGTIKNLKLVDNHENKGKGGVVRQGMLLAGGAYRVFMDADNSTSIDQFEHMLPFFEEGYDVVIGSRAVRGAKLEPAQPLYRQIIGKCLNLFIQTLLLPGIWDSQCGFKAFTGDAAEKVFTPSSVIGWGFDVEILALAKKLGFRIKEVPVHWVNDALSHMSISGGLKFVAEVLIIRWRLWTGAYRAST